MASVVDLAFTKSKLLLSDRFAMVIQPAMLHATETLPLTTQQNKILESAEIKMRRVTRNVRNEENNKGHDEGRLHRYEMRKSPAEKVFGHQREENKNSYVGRRVVEY